jgi:hypothetical protein
VLDGVGVVRTRFFEELHEVVHGRLCLALDVACILYGVLYTGAACSFIDAVIIVDRSLLVTPFVPLLASLSILLGT